MIPFKDHKRIQKIALAAPVQLETTVGLPEKTVALLKTYNRLGGILLALAKATNTSQQAALAVWMVECGTLDFIPDQPVIRFEVHKFWRHWGEAHATLFDEYFRFGGHANVVGSSWTNHQFRADSKAEWRRFHGDQKTEYQVFTFAKALATQEAACLSTSFGGPQILGSNHPIIGYATATAMAEDFAKSELSQVCGFFEFCRRKDILTALAQQDWQSFATIYNGPGQAAQYAALIQEAHKVAVEILAPRAP